MLAPSISTGIAKTWKPWGRGIEARLQSFSIWLYSRSAPYLCASQSCALSPALQLAGAAVWTPDLFNGAALLLAVGLAKHQGAAHRTGAIRRLLRLTDRSTHSPGGGKN